MKTAKLAEPTQSENLDRRERQFSRFVSIAFITMAGGMVVLMYPVVFSVEDFPGKRTLRIAFFGFCALSALFVLYFRERERTIRQFREQLISELHRHIQIERQASAELLQTLPDLSHFQDRLAMQFRRAASSNESLSVIVVMLKPSSSISSKNESLASLGDAAKAMSRRLRVDDSIFQLGAEHFGILLPNTDTATARVCASRLKEGLQDAAGIVGRFAFDLRILNYPEHVASAHGLDEIVCNLLSGKPLELVGSR